MKLSWILYFLLIGQVLLSSMDLGKYGKINTNSDVVFFDSSDFKVDDEIYIVISGYFRQTYIEYVFVDDISIRSSFTTSDLRREYATKTVTKTDIYDGYTYEERYYTIEKTRNHIKNGNGKYLLIYTDMYGYYDIENTKENHGNSKAVIIGVVLAVVVIAVIVGIIVYCYRRKKLAAMNQVSVPVYSDNNQVQVNNNNNVIAYNNNENNNGFNSNDNVYNKTPNYNYPNNNTPNYNYQNNNARNY